MTENNFSVHMILAWLEFESSELQPCSTHEMAGSCLLPPIRNHRIPNPTPLPLLSDSLRLSDLDDS